MPEPYYRAALARVHHEGFTAHPENVAPAIVRLLEPIRGGTVLELGCGSGLVTRHLMAAGHTVIATDASPAMLQLAAEQVPAADLRLLALPDDPLPPADAVVAVGHPLNYVRDAEEFSRAVDAIAGALRPGGVLAMDVCDLSWGATRRDQAPLVQVTDEWAITARFSVPSPDRYVREMTVFVPAGDGHWSRDDERHENVLVDVGAVAERFRSSDVETEVTDDFMGAAKPLPTGLFALVGHKH